MRRSLDLSNSNIPEKRTVMTFSMLYQHRRRPCNSGTQKGRHCIAHGTPYQISLALGEGQQPTDSPSNLDAKEDVDEGKPARQRQRVAEEDLDCCVDTCLLSFKNPHVCVKHRMRHFIPELALTRAVQDPDGQGGHNEMLKRHLFFPKYAKCKEEALRILRLESIPASNTAWTTPFCGGPVRPWEYPGFQLTDLELKRSRRGCAIPTS